MAPEVLHFPGTKELATRVAGDLADRLSRANGPFTIALSGGRIAGDLYDALAGFGAGPMRKAHFFWADERCVPPESPESNYGLARRRLFDPLGVPPTQIHRVPGELGPVPAARIAEADLRAVVGGSNFPELDLVLLGMGEDGHVASLFPGKDHEAPGLPAYIPVVDAPKPPLERVSLSFRALVSAREIWVLVAGEKKEEALKKALAGDEHLPLGRLLVSRPDLRLRVALPGASGANS